MSVRGSVHSGKGYYSTHDPKTSNIKCIGCLYGIDAMRVDHGLE